MSNHHDSFWILSLRKDSVLTTHHFTLTFFVQSSFPKFPYWARKQMIFHRQLSENPFCFFRIIIHFFVFLSFLPFLLAK